MEENSKKMIYLVKEGYQISPNAVKILNSNVKSVERFVEFLKQVVPEILVIEEEIINKFLKYQETKSETEASFQKPLKEEISEEPKENLEIKKEKQSIELNFLSKQIISHKKRKYPDYQRLFKSRYSQIKEIILPQISEPITPIEDSFDTPDDSLITTIGMVYTKMLLKDHMVLELESPKSKDRLNILFPATFYSREKRELFLDSVIAVSGRMRTRSAHHTTGKSTRFLSGKKIIYPGIISREINLPLPNQSNSRYMAIISDLHIGHPEFEVEIFDRFIRHISKGSSSVPGNECPDIIVIIGDIVHGTWNHNHGTNESSRFPSIQSRYEYLLEKISQVPKKTKIIIIPGEHDATRRSLPQPPIIQSWIRTSTKNTNIFLRENPCWLSIGNCMILLFHGQGFEKMGKIARLCESPLEFLVECLEQRHLSLQWGSEMLAPEPVDYLTVQNQPDLFISGHLHSAAVGKYKETLLVTSGTFSAQRPPLPRITPTIGAVPFIDLTTLKAQIVTLD